MIKRRFTDYIALPALTIVLIILVLGVFSYSNYRVYSIVESIALERLDNATDSVAAEIKSIFENNEIFLDIIADNISQNEDMTVDSYISVLKKYSSKIKATRISLILPDDEIVTIDGILEPTDLHFEDIVLELYQGDKFSSLDVSRLVKNQTIFRQYVPVERNGEVICVAYAVYTCDSFSNFIDNRYFDGKSDLLLFDRRDGKTVASSLAFPIGGVDYFDNRTDTKGNLINSNAIINGSSGNILFTYGSNNKNMYMSYAPVGGDVYEVALNISETDVMAELISYNRLLTIVSIAMCALFLAYGTWVLLKTRKDMKNMAALARTDILTGVRNSTWYAQVTEEYNRKIREGESVKFAVILCDVNGLKTVNDTLGHLEGDKYIKRCVDVINSAFHSSFIYRIGGDEFVIILDGREYERREDLFAYLRSLMSDKFNFAVSKADRVSFASGMSEYIPGKDTCFKDVQTRADDEMYENKRYIKGLTNTTAR